MQHPNVRSFWSIAAFTVLFSVTLFLFPQIDLTISDFFYHPSRGFLLENAYARWRLDLFRNAMIWATYGLLAVTSVMCLIGLCFKKMKMPWPPKTCLFVLICFIIVPVLIVNQTLKDHWGRARPYEVQQFGGDKRFTPAWTISNQCQKNCSFTSGETANVFCYLALLFIVRRKKLALGLILFMGFLMSFERIAQGHHFFSDTVLSALLDYLLIWIIGYTMIYWEKRECQTSIKN